jgi:hypothetical protein
VRTICCGIVFLLSISGEKCQGANFDVQFVKERSKCIACRNSFDFKTPDKLLIRVKFFQVMMEIDFQPDKRNKRITSIRIIRDATILHHWVRFHSMLTCFATHQ